LIKLEKTSFMGIHCSVWVGDEPSSTSELYTDQELHIVTSEEMAEIKKRAWINWNLNWLLIFCVYVNTEIWSWMNIL
jgi:hypothetical protein